MSECEGAKRRECRKETSGNGKQAKIEDIQGHRKTNISIIDHFSAKKIKTIYLGIAKTKNQIKSFKTFKVLFCMTHCCSCIQVIHSLWPSWRWWTAFEHTKRCPDTMLAIRAALYFLILLRYFHKNELHINAALKIFRYPWLLLWSQ